MNFNIRIRSMEREITEMGDKKNLALNRHNRERDHSEREMRKLKTDREREEGERHHRNER